MRVLVLGANGFVGRRLITALNATGWATPIAGKRQPTAAGDTTSVTLDARDETAITAAIASTKADAIINCVAGDAETITKNAAALFAAAAKSSTPVVYLSSMAVYGSATGLIHEDAPLQGDASPYAAAKVEAERLAAAAPHVTLLRPGCIYGSDSPQWTQRIARLLKEHRVGDLGPAGDGCTNLVHVQDVVAACIAALQRPPAGTRAYNLAMPNAPDWNAYFLAFARALGAVPIKRISDRRFKLETKLLAPALKIASMVPGGRNLPPPITPSLARTFRQDITIDPTRATQELEISWTSLSSGISEATAGLNL